MFNFLARVILIVIAITVVRSIFAWVQRFLASAHQPPTTQTRTPPQAPQATALEQDPVCGTYVSVDTSLKRIVKGRVYHFCSEACKDRFTA